MDALRARLAVLGLDLNNAANGVWLPGARAVETANEPAYHPRLTNDAYNRAIVDAFAGVNSLDEAREVLDSIRQQLQDRTFPGVRPRLPTTKVDP